MDDLLVTHHLGGDARERDFSDTCAGYVLPERCSCGVVNLFAKSMASFPWSCLDCAVVVHDSFVTLAFARGDVGARSARRAVETS